MKRISLFLVLTVLAGLSALAQGTAFTYQGRLTDNGLPANGSYDLTFSIFAAPGGGIAVAGPVTNSAVPVSNGLFTVTLDFGSGPFNGSDRWLQVAARTNSGGAFSTLLPRQPLTATPYAVRALAAGGVPAGAITSAMLADGAVIATKIAPGAVTQLGASDGSPTNAVSVNASGLVGIGTTDPQGGLDITASATIFSPQRLFQVQDGRLGYTNLNGAFSVASFGNLLAVGGVSDNGITVLDISNPQAPIRRSQFRDGDGSFTNLGGPVGVAMRPNLLAVAAFADNAVTLVSLTNPASPVRLAELRDGVGGWNELAGAWAVAIAGNLMAIAAYSDGAVTLADISNPSAPVKRIEMKDGLFGFTNLAGSQSVAISANLLAIGATTDDAVTLVDVSDPANPVKAAELRDGVGGYGNLNGVASVAFSGQLLAIGAFDDHAVTLVSVSNPASPVKLAEIVGSLSPVFSLAFSGDWLAVSVSGALILFDIANPSAPRQLAVIRDNIGGFNYLEGARGVAFAGTVLAVAGEAEDALTLVSFPPAAVGLLSQGWLGIGTDVPGAALHVVGDVLVESSELFDINVNRVELGRGSAASGSRSTAIGFFATASGDYATALGDSTTASGDDSMAMGYSTTASGFASTAMGYITTASGNTSTALGDRTIASGDYSTAMGRLAQATNQGALVWADSNIGTVTSTNNNSLTMRASGGYRLFSNSGATAGVYLAPSAVAWAVLSDREMKKNFQPLKGREILEKLAALPIQRWNYQWESDTEVPHIGPVAQDFKAAFYPGRDDKTITTLEFDGVALAAIQGLNRKLEEQMKAKDARIDALERTVAELKKIVERLTPIRDEGGRR